MDVSVIAIDQSDQSNGLGSNLVSFVRIKTVLSARILHSDSISERLLMKLSTIDVHTHIISKTYIDAIKKAGISNKEIGFPMDPWDAKQRLAEMDQYGVQAQILSVSSPGLRFWKGKEAADLARLLNHELVDLMKEYPSRFGAFATVPLPDVDASLAEIAWCLDEVHMDGVCLMSNYDGKYLGDPAFARVMDDLNRRKAVVFVHPTESVCIDQLNFGYPAPLIEYPFESTRMVVSLLDTDTIARCPDIRFIVSHGGGTLPIVTNRMAEIAPMKNHLDKAAGKALGERFKKQIATLYYDMAISCFPPNLAAIQITHDPARLMMGFDQPFIPAEAIGAAKDTIAAFKSFDELQQIRIDEGTAHELFPRLAKAIKV